MNFTIEVYSWSLLALAGRRLGRNSTGFGGKQNLDGQAWIATLDRCGELELRKETYGNDKTRRLYGIFMRAISMAERKATDTELYLPSSEL